LLARATATSELQEDRVTRFGVSPDELNSRLDRVIVAPMTSAIHYFDFA